jgi:hypothetical protein
VIDLTKPEVLEFPTEIDARNYIDTGVLPEHVAPDEEGWVDPKAEKFEAIQWVEPEKDFDFGGSFEE